MSNRTIRVNELIQRELSAILRQRYQTEAVMITIAEVRVSPDLRSARVFVAVVGDAETEEKKIRWLRTKSTDIRAELSRRIVLKYLPKFEFHPDASAVRGSRILQVIDEIEHPRARKPNE